MKKLLLVLSALPLLLSGVSCGKDNDCTDKTIASEAGTITAYAAANNIIGTTHASGIYYQITNPGTGTAPTISSDCKIQYMGKLLDGTVFAPQTTTPVTVQVAGTIPGFQVALQLLKEGGTIKVIIPSALAYGCAGSGSIPSSAILYFEIELIDVI